MNKMQEYFSMQSNEALLDLYTDFVKYHHYDPCGDMERDLKKLPVNQTDVYVELMRRMGSSGTYGY